MGRLDGADAWVRRRLMSVPGSAHIAGLRYPAFATAEELDELEPTRAAPRGGDPADYLVLRRRGEQRPSFAITTTEAANLLGLVQGYGSAREGSLEPIARVLHGFLGEDPRHLPDRCSTRRAFDRRGSSTEP